MTLLLRRPSGAQTDDSKPAPVLLVEDSRLFSAVLSYRLQRDLGLEVVHCASLGELDAAMARHPGGFSLAVADLTLPGSPNGEVLKPIAAQNIPTIVFTASFDFVRRNWDGKATIVDYVLKDSELALDNVLIAVRRVVTNHAVRMLVAAADPVLRAEIAAILGRQRYDVTAVASGAEALRLIGTDPDYAVVLVDEVLADMGGAELIRRVRARQRVDALRMIGITSQTDRFYGVHYLKSGAQEFLVRPFLAEELQCLVQAQVDILQQLDSLKSVAASDYLTGLFNRRYFYDEGPKRVNKALKSGHPVSIGVLDIDHFKRLNDTYGHEIGDRVLVAVAARLSETVAGTDFLLSRLGGEEFGMLLPGLDAAAATHYFDGLRRKIGTVRVMADEEELSVTISIGVAEVRGYETFDNYINAADQFLYMAKHRGRDQVFSDYIMAEEARIHRRAAAAH